MTGFQDSQRTRIPFMRTSNKAKMAFSFLSSSLNRHFKVFDSYFLSFVSLAVSHCVNGQDKESSCSIFRVVEVCGLYMAYFCGQIVQVDLRTDFLSFFCQWDRTQQKILYNILRSQFKALELYWQEHCTNYNSRVIIYDHKGFIISASGGGVL